MWKHSETCDLSAPRDRAPSVWRVESWLPDTLAVQRKRAPLLPMPSPIVCECVGVGVCLFLTFSPTFCVILASRIRSRTLVHRHLVQSDESRRNCPVAKIASHESRGVAAATGPTRGSIICPVPDSDPGIHQSHTGSLTLTARESLTAFARHIPPSLHPFHLSILFSNHSSTSRSMEKAASGSKENSRCTQSPLPSPTGRYRSR